MLKYYPVELFKTPEIESVLIYFQLCLIKKKKIPNITCLQERYFKYQLEVKGKTIDFIVFQPNNQLEKNLFMLNLNYLLTISDEYEMIKNSKCKCIENNTVFGRFCLQNITMDCFCLCIINKFI